MENLWTTMTGIVTITTGILTTSIYYTPLTMSVINQLAVLIKINTRNLVLIGCLSWIGVLSMPLLCGIVTAAAVIVPGLYWIHRISDKEMRDQTETLPYQ